MCSRACREWSVSQTLLCPPKSTPLSYARSRARSSTTCTYSRPVLIIVPSPATFLVPLNIEHRHPGRPLLVSTHIPHTLLAACRLLLDSGSSFFLHPCICALSLLSRYAYVAAELGTGIESILLLAVRISHSQPSVCARNSGKVWRAPSGSRS